MMYDVWLTLKKETNELEHIGHFETSGDMHAIQTSAVIHDNETSDDIYNNQTSGDHNIENSADIHAIQTSAVIHDNEFSDNIIYNNQTSGDHNIENSADIQAIQTSGVIHDNETADDIYNNQTSGDHNIENSADIQTPADNHHTESFTLESDEINNTCNPSINSHNQTITRNKTSSAESNRQSTERDDPVSYNEPNLLTPNVSHTNRAKPIKNLNDFFKDILRYPATKNFPAKKKHLPSVLTCDEVLKHQTLKENLKKEADDLKMKKKEERTKKAEEKKKLQDLKKKTGKKGPNKVQSQPKKPILQNVVISESSSDEDSCTALPENRDEIRKRGSRGLCFKQELLETSSQLPSNHPLDLDHTQALEEMLQPNPEHETQLSVHDTQLYLHDAQLSEHDTRLSVSDTQPPVPTHHTHLPLTKPADQLSVHKCITQQTDLLHHMQPSVIVNNTQTTDPVPTKQQVDPEPELATSTVPDSIFNIIESVAYDAT
ncbi:hypothetical protein WDU94_015543 [Cyamophila willieti]